MTDRPPAYTEAAMNKFLRNVSARPELYRQLYLAVDALEFRIRRESTIRRDDPCFEDVLLALRDINNQL